MTPAELRHRGRALSRSAEQHAEPAGGAPSRTHNQVSDVADSVLNVLSCASSLGLRARGGRTLLQMGESKDKLPTTVVTNVCPSHSRFQPISADIERSRKPSKEARFRALKAVARVRIPSGLQGGVASQRYFASRLNSITSPVVHSGYTPESAEALAESMASATTSSRSPKRWPYRSSVMVALLWPSIC
jgi:hypothetical protein